MQLLQIKDDDEDGDVDDEWAPYASMKAACVLRADNAPAAVVILIVTK